jgi:hypothetical protein
MLKKKMGIYWRFCWGGITPVLMLVILVYAMAIMKPETYHDEPFPTSAYGKMGNITQYSLRRIDGGKTCLTHFMTVFKCSENSWGRGGCGSVVVKPLCYKPENRGFDTR